MTESHDCRVFHVVFSRNKLDASTVKYYDRTLVIVIQLEQDFCYKTENLQVLSQM